MFEGKFDEHAIIYISAASLALFALITPNPDMILPLTLILSPILIILYYGAKAFFGTHGTLQRNKYKVGAVVDDIITSSVEQVIKYPLDAADNIRKNRK